MLPRFHLINAAELRSTESNPIKKVLELDEANEFGDEQLRRANGLLRSMHPAVYDLMQKSVVDEIIHSSSSSSSSDPSSATEKFIVRLNDDSPMPKSSVLLFAALLDCVADAQSSLRSKVLDRRLPLVTFIHEFIASVYEIRASYADSLKSTACLLRMLSNFSLLTAWAFFEKSAKTVAKQDASNFTASLSRTTIMGLRRTSAIETVESAFSAASTRTNVLHSNINDAFATMAMMESSRRSEEESFNFLGATNTDFNNTAKTAIEKRLASYYNEPISVPVFEEAELSSPVKGHVQLTRWFLTLANLAEESDEALIAALLQEIDFVSERLIEHFVDGYEAELGTSIAGVAASKKRRMMQKLREARGDDGNDNNDALPEEDDDDDDDEQLRNLTALSPSRRRIGYSDFDQAKEVLGLVHPLTNDFAKVVEAITDITNLLRPCPNKQQQSNSSESDTNSNNKNGSSSVINWSHNLAVHRLACGVVALFLERVSAAIMDSFGICLQRCDSLKDEYLLMRNDIDGCYVKQCLSLLERTLSDDLGLDDYCLESLLPLRELCDLLALPPDCFETEGIFYSATPKALVKTFVFEQIGGAEDIPSLAPRSSNQCSLLDLVTCGDLLHGCPDDGLKVESDSELTALRWDLTDFIPERVSAAKYRREAESKRIASAKTFAEIFKGVSHSLLSEELEQEEQEQEQEQEVDKKADDKNTTHDEKEHDITQQFQEREQSVNSATRNPYADHEEHDLYDRRSNDTSDNYDDDY